MVKEYKKGSKVQISEHFNLSEFDCHCTSPTCTVTYLDSTLISRLELVRNEMQTPLKIMSGFRCTEHNRLVGGKPGSQHLQGKAADITPPDISLLKPLRKVCDLLMDGVGAYSTFIHGDVRGYAARWIG